MQPPVFPAPIRDALRDLLVWRRDVRAFRRDPLPAGLVDRLLATACLSPSVGLSEPWRFVIVEDHARRAAVRRSFERANAEALAGQDEDRRSQYARMKLAGLDEAPTQVAVFADHASGQGHGLGRLSMPETVDYSVAIAIHTLWLAARLEGVGVGWVSILDPAEVTAALAVEPDWRLIGYLCLGYPSFEDDCPTLQRDHWERRREAACRIFRR